MRANKIKTCRLRALTLVALSITLGAARASSAPSALAAYANNSMVTCRDLQQDSTRAQWLTLPFSRLVINPTMPITAPLPPEFGPSLPLNLAYYAGEKPVELPFFWAWQTMPAAAARPAVTDGPAIDLSTSTAAQWQAERIKTSFDSGHARLAVAEANYGSLSTTVTVNLDETPFLLARVADVDIAWALKVSEVGASATANGTRRAPEHITLVQDTAQAGDFILDVASITRWRGRKTFKIILFAVGAPGQGVSVQRLQFFGVRGVSPGFAGAATTWFPHQLVTRATAGGAIGQRRTAQTPDTPAANTHMPNTRIESTVALLDEATVAQRLRVLPQQPGRSRAQPQTIVLMGQMRSGAVRWDAARRALTLRGDRFHATVTLSRRARWLGMFASGLDWLAGRAAPQAQNGIWAIAVDGVQAGEETIATARFAPTPNVSPDTREGALGFAHPARFEAALRGRETDWNRRLSRVPHPRNFALRLIDNKGATTAAMRRTYYKAWVFLLSDILPPMPENRFAFPQLACGKPSLWSEGAPPAWPSAQWESMIAMQLVAWVEPAVAQTASEGQMSLVAPDGTMNGEGLPSRHAQTAWILFALSGDKARLRRVYPALKRLLLWKAADPRWIYKGATPPGHKDAEFVTHALLDMGYARRIAKVLGQPAEDTFWQTRSEALAADYHRWFFDADNRMFRLYQATTGERGDRNGAWALQALALPPAILRQPQRQSLLKVFRAGFDANLSFAVPALYKYPVYSFTQRGVWQYGLQREAAMMAEIALRDITRAGEFSENYSQGAPPTPQGVTPSVFGAAHIIDAALWHNGVRPGEGLPVLVRLPGMMAESGVENLRVRGDLISVRFQADDEVELRGAGLRHIRRPDGFQILSGAASPVWRGQLAEGGELALQAD